MAPALPAGGGGQVREHCHWEDLMHDVELPPEVDDEPLAVCHARAACGEYAQSTVVAWREALERQMGRPDPFGKSPILDRLVADQGFVSFRQGVQRWKAALERTEKTLHPLWVFRLASEDVLAYIGL